MFKYGMRHRGFAPACQPMEGFDHREDDLTGKYYDIIVYKRELTKKEICDYELEIFLDKLNDDIKKEK